MTTETSAPRLLGPRRIPSRRARGRHADRGRSYTAVASFYEGLAACYSGGQIAAAKRAQLAEMRPADRVLYVGVGAGEDAIEAARLGVQLTCLDLSSAMLARLEARLGDTRAEIICGNAFDHHRPGYYDVVTANFFLNCLSEPCMREMLAHLSTLLRPGGKLLIADLAFPQGSFPARLAQRAYSRFANVSFRMLGLVSLHPIYDYRRALAACHFPHVHSTSFRLFGFGPIAYETLTAVRTP
ncbi:MAG TPA: methyltransferase domain-containing protein [Pirellulales bacterium]|nr:methyltransferase domain-containing protein [Pirellulales bacterium]